MPGVSRHTVVCRAAQENRGCTIGVSILTRTTKSRFSRIHSSLICSPNGTVTKFTVELAFISLMWHDKKKKAI